jgi:hypothetical protein
MGFSNTQTRVKYQVGDKETTDLKVAFKYMEDNGLNNIGSLTIAQKTIDTKIYETPEDDEFVGIPSLAAYNIVNSTEPAYDPTDFVSSVGVTAGSTKESAYIGPALP